MEQTVSAKKYIIGLATLNSIATADAGSCFLAFSLMIFFFFFFFSLPLVGWGGRSLVVSILFWEIGKVSYCVNSKKKKKNVYKKKKCF